MNRSVITLGVVVLAALSVSGLAGVAVEGTLGADASQSAPTESMNAAPATTPQTDSVSPDTPRSETTAAVVTQSTKATSTPKAAQATPADPGTDIDTTRVEDRLVADLEPRVGQRGDLVAPEVPGVGEAVEQQDDRALAVVEHRERAAVDLDGGRGALHVDRRWRPGLAVG